MIIKEKIIKEVNKALGLKLKAEILTDPPKIEMGEFALPCFEMAKLEKKSPNDVALAYAEKLNGQISGLWQKVEARGPYVNFFMTPEFWNQDVLISQKQDKPARQLDKIMVEFSQPNTHKEFHVGHLRNACLGASLVNLYRYQGYKVIAANYIGDVGTHVAKCLWNFINNHLSDELPVNKGKYLGSLYSEAVQIIGENEELKAEVSDLLQKLEAGEKDLKKLWQETKAWSMQQFKQIYDNLGIEFDEWFFESEEEAVADKIINKIVKDKKIPEIKISEGAIIADLEKYDLGVLVLIKSDGTKAYGAKDIPLTIKKFEKYKIDKSVWVVDNRQTLYLKQIFKIMQLLGYKNQMVHIDYDFVTLPEGAMASRKGNVIAFEDFYDTMLDKVINETKNKHEDWPKDVVNKVANTVAMSALKFGMLKYENKRVITFDMDEALSLEGATGPYLLYTVARINSILKRPDLKVSKKNNYSLLAEIEEKDLIKHLSKLDETISLCVKYHQPSYLATYLIELAQKFNSYYHQYSVIRADKQLKQARLSLLQATFRVLTGGLQLLNIKFVEEM